MTKFYISITYVLIWLSFGCTNSGPITDTTKPESIVNVNINRDNYYEFTKPGGVVPITTNWLRRHEAIPVILDELKKLGYKTNEYVLYELEDGNNILLDVYNRENDLGVIYNTGHYAQVKKEQRNIRIFNQDKFKYSGNLGKRLVYDKLPDNIIILQETWYWYQYQEGTHDESLLNKATAEQILRQDVRAFVEEFKKGRG